LINNDFAWCFIGDVTGWHLRINSGKLIDFVISAAGLFLDVLIDESWFWFVVVMVLKSEE
jgi:hypothetical protein